MLTTAIAQTDLHDPQTLARARRYGLIAATITVLAALFTHHPALAALTAWVMLLLGVLLERMQGLASDEERLSSRSLGGAHDGGAFRAGVAPIKASRRRAAQRPVVWDGGSH